MASIQAVGQGWHTGETGELVGHLEGLGADGLAERFKLGL